MLPATQSQQKVNSTFSTTVPQRRVAKKVGTSPKSRPLGSFGRASVEFNAASTDPLLMPSLVLVLKSCALWAVGHVGDPLAKFVLSVPEVLAMLRVLGREAWLYPEGGG
jgi:hypothetical protein